MKKKWGIALLISLFTPRNITAKGYMDEIADFLQTLHPHQEVQP